MTSQEYTQWLKGFLDAINGYDISKRQFDTIREKLKEVDDTIGTPIGNGWGSPNWGGIVTYPTTTPYSIPLTGTITTTGGTLTTSSYPSGSTVTYTTTNGSGGAYSLTGNTTTTSAYINQNDDGDEKLLLD
jgi:hypothetical protein